MIEFFLPAIISLGIITSYEDIKYGKIRNKWILFALAYAILAYSVLTPYYYFHAEMNVKYLIELISNLTISIIIGYALWHYNIWSAGDSKLFIAFASLIPLTAYTNGYYSHFPALTLLTNIFLITLTILLIMLVIRVRMKNITAVGQAIKATFGFKKTAESILIFFSLFWIIQLPLELIKANDIFLRMAILIAIFPYLQKRLGKKLVYISLGLAPIRLIFDSTTHTASFIGGFILMVLFWVVAIGFLNQTINKLSNELFIKKIKTGKLEKGMIINDLIEKKNILTLSEKKDRLAQGAEIKKYKGSYYIRIQDNDKNVNKEEIELTIKKISELKRVGFEEIRIKQTIRLAPFIFTGVIATLLTKGNILIYARNLF